MDTQTQYDQRERIMRRLAQTAALLNCILLLGIAPAPANEVRPDVPPADALLFPTTVVVTVYVPDPRWAWVRWDKHLPLHGETAACPESWRERTIHVPGVGWRVCEDTPRDDTLGGLAHVDLFVDPAQATEQERLLLLQGVTVLDVLHEVSAAAAQTGGAR